MAVPQGTALIVIDVQTAFDDPRMGARNNPGCEANVARLLSAWRAAKWPIIHVRHHNVRNPNSLFYSGKPGRAVKPEAKELPGEPVIVKSVHSAFIGTDLDDVLSGLNAEHLLLCGIQTNYCVATTARMAGNLDYNTFVAHDACATFDQKMLDGSTVPAKMAHDLALAEIQGEFGTIISTADAVKATTH